MVATELLLAGSTFGWGGWDCLCLNNEPRVEVTSSQSWLNSYKLNNVFANG